MILSRAETVLHMNDYHDKHTHCDMKHVTSTEIFIHVCTQTHGHNVLLKIKHSLIDI